MIFFLFYIIKPLLQNLIFDLFIILLFQNLSVIYKIINTLLILWIRMEMKFIRVIYIKHIETNTIVV
jgi:hypothetical protein